MNAVCAVLAAGTSSRMGAQKLVLPLAGRPLVEHALDAACGYPTVINFSPGISGWIKDGRAVVGQGTHHS